MIRYMICLSLIIILYMLNVVFFSFFSKDLSRTTQRDVNENLKVYHAHISNLNRQIDKVYHIILPFILFFLNTMTTTHNHTKSIKNKSKTNNYCKTLETETVLSSVSSVLPPWECNLSNIGPSIS